MDDVIRTHDGKLVLYRRNGIWQARLHLGGNNYLPKSLKTSNTEEAKRLGEELWHDTRYELSKGLPVRKRTLNSVLDEYILFRERDNEMGKVEGSGSSIKYTSDEMLRQIRRVQNFWREYAGKKLIDAIDNRVVSDYVPWRKNFYHNMSKVPKRAKLNPADKTLQWEMMFGKMVLRYAKDRGYLGNKPVPSFSFTLKTRRVRPDFTIGDFGHLSAALVAWIDKANSAPRKASRELLRDYVLTLALSGIRIGEANNLKVRDVQKIKDDSGRENIQFHVRGKTGARVVVPHIDVKEIIDGLLARRGDPGQDEWLFAMPNGQKIVALRDQFDALLTEFKLTHNAAGSKHSLYSLRHFYAVRAIARDIDIYTIARNMGTSVQMIEQYYGKHATTTSRATKLGGTSGSYNQAEDPVERRRKPKVAQLREAALFSAAFALWSKLRRKRSARKSERHKWVEFVLRQNYLRCSADDLKKVDTIAASLSDKQIVQFARDNGLLGWFAQHKVIPTDMQDDAPKLPSMAGA